MIKIITVLKTSKEYTPEKVKIIQRMCKRHITIPFEFICYSDVDIDGMTVRKLKHNWSGWYSKMEMYQEEGPCLFMDLDTIITNNIDGLIKEALKYKFIILRDFYRGYRKHAPPALKAKQSSLMFWNINVKPIYDDYVKNVRTVHGGDQIILEQYFADKENLVTYWQDIDPSIVSFKTQLRAGKVNQMNTKIVIFHGKPRPWEQNMIRYE